MAMFHDAPASRGLDTAGVHQKRTRSLRRSASISTRRHSLRSPALHERYEGSDSVGRGLVGFHVSLQTFTTCFGKRRSPTALPVANVSSGHDGARLRML